MECQKHFWNWFKMEWHIYEQQLVQYFIDKNQKFDQEIWLKEMKFMIENRKVEQSFYQYQRLFFK